DADVRLMALGEILGHIADDVVGSEDRFGFATNAVPWSATDFLPAIEREDEAAAVGLLRAALAQPAWPDDFAGALFGVGLQHYADFGHTMIYVAQALRLIDRLGREVAGPVLLSLVRSLVYARREDLLPEFRDYRSRLDAWWASADNAPALDAAALRRISAKQAMAITAAWGPIHRPEAIFAVLVEAAAWQMLHADEPFFESPDQKLSENVDWLDFTHALTFAAAGLDAVRADASLWPALLLQLACFIGRNGRYVDPVQETGRWQVRDVPSFRDQAIDRIVHHSQGRFIHSAHLAKTLFAAIELAEATPGAAQTVLAATNRFLQAPLRGRSPLRTARQMIGFVAEE
ncbi:MAG TPA: hypothetical protein VGV37_11675, partial [Aliidongia sp.]|uniref:hypothetical protein n=1 Tax=Aliidongia sp. TaxID=1914230 RepID=UPI002DDCFF7B